MSKPGALDTMEPVPTLPTCELLVPPSLLSLPAARARDLGLNPTRATIAEAFSQRVSESNSPPGTSIFGGFYRQLSDCFGIDGGMRFGVSDYSASIGALAGMVLGKRLHGDPSAPASILPFRRP